MPDHAVGIDISKFRPDACRPEDATATRFETSARGFRALIRWLGKSPVARIVFEPANPYHRAVEAALPGKFPRVLVKPLQARRFAGACGAQAGTDAVVARILVRMGAALALEPDAPASPELQLLRELQVARRALITGRTRLRKRGQVRIRALVKRRLAKRLALVDRQIADLDADIARLIAEDGTMARSREILRGSARLALRGSARSLLKPSAGTVCPLRRTGANPAGGFAADADRPELPGPVASALILTFLPGIGRLGSKQAPGKAGRSSAGAASRCGMRSACLPLPQCATTLA